MLSISLWLLKNHVQLFIKDKLEGVVCHENKALGVFSDHLDSTSDISWAMNDENKILALLFYRFMPLMKVSTCGPPKFVYGMW